MARVIAQKRKVYKEKRETFVKKLEKTNKKKETGISEASKKAYSYSYNLHLFLMNYLTSQVYSQHKTHRITKYLPHQILNLYYHYYSPRLIA